MARPKKEGLQYYPKDTNFYNNQKVINISNRFGSFGSDIYCRLITDIYQKYGYYLKFDLNYFDFFIGQTRCPEDTFFEILNFMNSRNYLKIKSINDVYDENNLLCVDSLPLLITAESVQEQYRETVKTMKRKPDIYLNLWLLEIDDTDSSFVFNENWESENILLADKDVYKNNIKFLQNSNKFEFIQNKQEETKSKKEKTSNDSEFSTVSFNNKEKENKSKSKKKVKDKVNSNNNDVPIKSENTQQDLNMGKRKKKRYSQKDKPENNYGEPVSKLSEKTAYGEFDNVWLTDKELQRLKKNYPDSFDEIIETLSSYKASAEKGYKSDYAAMTNWVIKRVTEDRQRNKRGNCKKNKKSEITQDRMEAANQYEENMYKQFRNNVDEIEEEDNDELMQSFMDTVKSIGKQEAVI